MSFLAVIFKALFGELFGELFARADKPSAMGVEHSKPVLDTIEETTNEDLVSKYGSLM